MIFLVLISASISLWIYTEKHIPAHLSNIKILFVVV